MVHGGLVGKALAIGMLALSLAVTGCSGGSSESGGGSSSSGSSSDEQAATETEATADAALSYGSTFDFDDFAIQLGDGVTTTTLSNQFSENDGATVLALPITVTNNSDETKSLNMFYLKEFGSQGTELDTIYTYFNEDDIRMAGEMRPGASMSKNLYFLYDGDGTYVIEFEKPFGEKFEVELPVTLG